MFSSIPIDWP